MTECSRSHTDLENSGANSTIRGNNAAGSVSIWRPLVEKVVFSLRCLPLLFQRSKMAKSSLDDEAHYIMTLQRIFPTDFG